MSINNENRFYTEEELTAEKEALNKVNFTYTEEDTRKKRRGATSLAHFYMLRSMSSKELLCREVSIVAENHKDLDFNLKVEGTNGFKLYCNKELVLNSDFDFFESCLQKDYKTFRDLLDNILAKKENS